jgi:hypothetical protein
MAGGGGSPPAEGRTKSGVPEPATWPAQVGPPGQRPDQIMATWPAQVGPPGQRPDQITVPRGAGAGHMAGAGGSPRPKKGKM